MGESLEEQGQGSSPNKIYTSVEELFWDCLPHYLAMGMSNDEFWHGDAKLAIAYREADEIRRDNQLYAEMRAGRYVYEALLAASPAFREWSKGIEYEYPTEPVYMLSKGSNERLIQQEKAAMNRNKAFMDTFMVTHNMSFKENEGDSVA